jgi:hypothetical protein
LVVHWNLQVDLPFFLQTNSPWIPIKLPPEFNFTSLLHSPPPTSLPSNFNLVAFSLTFGNFDGDLLHEAVIGPTVGVFHAGLDLPVTVLQLDCSLNSENREKRVE